MSQPLKHPLITKRDYIKASIARREEEAKSMSQPQKGEHDLVTAKRREQLAEVEAAIKRAKLDSNIARNSTTE